MKSLLDKKGQFTITSMGAVGIAFVIAAIIFGIGAAILSDIGEDISDTSYTCGSTGTYAFNATCNGAEGIDTISGWLPTIGLIVAAAIVIGIVVGSLGRTQ